MRETVANFGEKLDFAVLDAAWNRFFFGSGWRPNKQIMRAEHDHFSRSLEETIALLQQRGVRRILVIGPVPEFAAEASTCLSRAASTGRSPEICSVKRSLVDERRKDAVQSLLQGVEGKAGVRYVDPLEVFCDEDRCQPIDKGGILYTDDNHLSQHGSNAVYQAFKLDFEWVMGVEKAEDRGTSLAYPAPEHP